MALIESFIWRGYLPENVPPSFFTSDIGDYIADNPGVEWWSQANAPVRPATYNASKRGATRRTFSFVHPATMRDAAKFIVSRWQQIHTFFGESDYSLSVPKEVEGKDRAIEITSHTQLESELIARLSHHRFIARTDISRFYHSIYTHSLPWAFHGKAQSKADKDAKSDAVFFNRADFILRCGQDGQTVGIPVGPDTSRVFAEVVATAIDLEFRKRIESSELTVIRHVDDVWIGANTHGDAERALWRYREAMREFELDINENKTRIYSSDFKFTDAWPSDLSVELEGALEGRSSQKRERLRALLEQAFALAVKDSDEGILKFVIRYLDRHSEGWENWEIIEPFLKRCAVHFGHTVDYIARIITWRHLAKGDLDIQTWARILTAIIDSHGRIGNDSEVCWAIYASIRLQCQIPAQATHNIARNCGALSLVGILNCVESGLVPASVIQIARDRLSVESARGAFWPVILEWKSRRWAGHSRLRVENALITSLVSQGAVLFDIGRLPAVFKDVEEQGFGGVEMAIEDMPTYDDPESE